jgi:hypothetical protein
MNSSKKREENLVMSSRKDLELNSASRVNVVMEQNPLKKTELRSINE